MYVRTIRDSSGRIFLQQFLKFQEPARNGRPSEVVERWETVPTVGVGGVEALALPIGQSCGLLMFDAVETIFSSVIEGHKDVKALYVVSALDVYKISMLDNNLIQVFTKEKMAFKVSMPYHDFLELMVSLLNNFKIVKFDESGKLKGE